MVVTWDTGISVLAYYRTGKYQLAIGDFDQAIKLKRDFAQA